MKNKELTLKGVLPNEDAKKKTLALADQMKKKGVKIIDMLTVEAPEVVVMPPGKGPNQPDNLPADKPLIPLDTDKGELHSVYFGTGEATISSAQTWRTKKLLESAKQTTGKIVIDGFADERGDENTNSILSKDRAMRVRKYLIENGIDENRIISVTGRGAIINGNYREHRRTDVRIVK